MKEKNNSLVRLGYNGCNGDNESHNAEGYKYLESKGGEEVLTRLLPLFQENEHRKAQHQSLLNNQA